MYIYRYMYIYVNNNILQFMYMYDLCLKERKHDTYDFLDLQLIHLMGDKKAKIEIHIINKFYFTLSLQENCYLETNF